ncbi:hypothetical protein KOJCDNHJ_00184 [Xanthomonas citri pv. punicae]|nr:hypothetical protein FICKIIDM_00691 [Xanthomonas citri pv. punicae]UIS26800.1 hypothetical protein KOJCDNHJ_00184 [Xanthomonas citri pv. punicae]
MYCQHNNKNPAHAGFLLAKAANGVETLKHNQRDAAGALSLSPSCFACLMYKQYR